MDGTRAATRSFCEEDTAMFRDGRRKKQFLSTEATEEILRRGLAGVLGTNSDDGCPYTVPISYAYDGGKLLHAQACCGLHKPRGWSLRTLYRGAGAV